MLFQQLIKSITLFLPARCITYNAYVDINSCNKSYTLPYSQKKRKERKEIVKNINPPYPLVFSTKDDCDLPCIFWIPKLHKNQSKNNATWLDLYIYTTKPLSKLLTFVLIATLVTPDVVLIQCGSIEDLLKTLSSRLLSEYNCIKVYDFSTLYTSFPNTQLESRL